MYTSFPVSLTPLRFSFAVQKTDSIIQNLVEKTMDPVSCQCMNEAAPLLQHSSGHPVGPLSDPVNHTCRAHIIDFDPDGDPDNPMNWPSSFKWTIVALLAAMAFTV